jgi:hypothetical protein
LAGASELEKLVELLDGEPCLADDVPERTGTNLLVVGNNQAAIRALAVKNHVTPSLAVEYESCPLKGLADLLS